MRSKVLVREYKKSDLEEISKVHVDAWNTTYVGIIPQEYLQSRTYEEQQEKWRKRLFENNDTKEFMFVLENDDKQVVGFSTAMVNDKPSETDSTLYTIYIDKDYQGIASL